FWANWMGSFILKSVQPDRKQKIKTVPVWEPRTGNIDTDILDQFARHQERLSQYINDLDGINIAIASPASKFIVYTLDKALDIITTHEKRHLEQARELAGLLKSVQP
ncbi:MAG: DinB family protein, partial [Bacteroidota bacterium]